MFVDSIDLLFIFADGWGRGVKKLVIFCGRHKWMTPKVNVIIIILNRDNTHMKSMKIV